MFTSSSARRGSAFAALATAGALVLASCSSSSTPAAAGSSSSSASAPAATSAAAAPASAAPASAAPASSAAAGSAAGSSSAASGASLASLVPADMKSVTFGVYSDWAPEEFIQNGQVAGWSVDLAKAMAASLGMTVKYEPTGFDTIIPGLGNGRYAAGVASLAVTPERLKTVDFLPLQKDGSSFGWKKGNPLKINSVKDACGKSVAVLTGAFDFQYLTEQNKVLCGSTPMKIEQFKDQPSAELAVTSGRVDLVSAGTGKLGYTAKQGGQLEVSALMINAVYNGIGLPKGSKLGPALKAALQQAIDDGTYAKVRAQWGATSKTAAMTKALLITEANPEG